MKPHEKCNSNLNEETIRPEIQGSPEKYFGFPTQNGRSSQFAFSASKYFANSLTA